MARRSRAEKTTEVEPGAEVEALPPAQDPLVRHKESDGSHDRPHRSMKIVGAGNVIDRINTSFGR